MNVLPCGIIQAIFKNLDKNALMAMSRVSHFFSMLAYSDPVWKQKCIEDFGAQPTEPWKRESWIEFYKALSNPKVYTGKLLSRHVGQKGIRSKVAKGRENKSFNGKKIRNVLMVDEKMYIQSKSGRLYIKSCNKMKLPKMLRTPEKYRFQSISCCGEYFIGLTYTGMVYHGYEGNIHLVKNAPLNIVQVLTTYEASSILLTKEGSLWFVPDPLEYEETEPRAIFAVNFPDTVIQIINANSMTLALTQSGRILLLNTSQHTAFIRSPHRLTTELKRFSHPHNRSLHELETDFAICNHQGSVVLGDADTTSSETLPWHSQYLEGKTVKSLVYARGIFVAITTKGEFIAFDRQFEYNTHWLQDKYVISFDFSGEYYSILAIDK
ncbi:hypothetical protein BY458DRAFT_524132 [Sporodiniella umbellata]|nr:hypothetical protein BY458DRAFT_524132 [Sporodiniella umbellata]